MDSKRNWKHICCSVLRILLCMILLYGCQTAVKTESTPIVAVETEPAFEESAPSEAPVLAEPDRIRTVYEPETAYSCPPTVIQKVENVAQFETLASAPAPQGAWFILNDAGNAICLQEKEVLLHEVFAKCYGTIIPVFELPSASAAESLQAFTKASRTMDFLVAAETAEILRSVSAVGVGKVLITDRVTESTSQEVWQAGATAVVVPQITADEAADLQLHWIAVLLQPPLAAEDAVRAALQCGADMVVTTDARAAYRVYSSAAPESSVVRKTFIVAHRGVHDHAPENTLASFTEAVKAGADAVECDVYITKDGHAVICHNETVGMYVTDGTDVKAEDLTRAELKALPLNVEEAYADERFAFLDELMDAMTDFASELEMVDSSKLIFVGHSQGGMMGMITACDDNLKERFLGMLLFAPGAGHATYLDEFGSLDNLPDSYTILTEKVGRDFLYSAVKYEQIVWNKLCDYTKPVKIWIGDADEIIPTQTAIALAAAFGENASYEIVPGGYHDFRGDVLPSLMPDSIIPFLDSLI